MEGFKGNKILEMEATQSIKRAVIRLLVRIKTPLIGQFVDKSGKRVGARDDLQNWEHLLIFESDLTASEPLKSKYKSEDYKEWLGYLNRETQVREVDYFRHR